MRDLCVVVPCRDLAEAVSGLLTRRDCVERCRFGPINFDPLPPSGDLIIDTMGKDPGVYRRAHELLRGHLSTHRQALVVCDSAWEGSPGAGAIKAHIEGNLDSSGWKDRRAVVVIEPELEIWVWAPSRKVDEVLGWNVEHGGPLRAWLEGQKLWEPSAPKPARPKQALRTALRRAQRPPSSAMFRRLGEALPPDRCSDEAMKQLMRWLRATFPPKHQ